MTAAGALRRNKSVGGLADNKPGVDIDAVVRETRREVVALTAVIGALAGDHPGTLEGLALLRRIRNELEAIGMPLARPLTSTRLDSDAEAFLRRRVRDAQEAA